MKKVGFSGKPPKVSAPSVNDIPEALRDTPDAVPRRRLKPVLTIAGLVGLGVLVFSFSLWYFASTLGRNTSSVPSVASSSAPSQVPTPSTDSANNSNTLLGHFAYPEAPLGELQPTFPGSSVKLQKAAVPAFQAMVAAARAAGVNLVPISGFRSVADQQHLFFDVKAQRGQVAAERAAVSAPPGYSEHHTGYVIDIGDGNVPATNLSPTFEKTKAFQWLAANAARFSFEMSFPKNNPQGVSYEPWHWRFVGNRHSLETFYKARNLKLRTTP